MPKSMVYKILTAGDGGVGKTTLLHRYVEGKFLHNTQMTMGVEFFTQQLKTEEGDVMLQLWDFGGQEQFRFMLNRYVVGAKGALVLFDLTRYGTLTNIDEWVKIITSDDPNISKILIGTKLDLTDDIQIQDEEAMEIKEKYGFDAYLKTSSKSGENVIDAFQILTENIIKKQFY